MHSSTLFILLTVFLVSLAISVSAYPGGEEKEKKEEKKDEGKKEGKSEEKEKKDGAEEGGKSENKESGAMSLLSSSSSFCALISLAITSIILSIH